MGPAIRLVSQMGHWLITHQVLEELQPSVWVWFDLVHCAFVINTGFLKVKVINSYGNHDIHAFLYETILS